MSRHTGYQDMSEAEFLRTIAANVEALNAATAKSRPRRCGCTSAGATTKARTTSTSRSRRSSTWCSRRARRRSCSRPPTRATSTNGSCGGRRHRGKVLAPGLIDSCSNYLETPELIAQRIERFAAFVGKDRVVASSDCGFGTFAGYGKIDPAVAWKKLAALREGARIAAKRSA